MGSIGSDQCADLKSISLAQLLAGDAASAKDLVQACKEHGFFYLDFRSPSTSRSLQHVDELIGVGNAVFALPLEEKEAYSTEKYLPSRLLGYKRAGCSVGPFAEKKDGYESFSIHNNGIFGNDALIVPAAIEENLGLVTAWMADIHHYTDCILSILSRHLHLERDLKDCHRRDHPSAANMAMLKYLAWGSHDDMVGNMAHTDMGTLTVVFSKVPGLQALLPGRDGWTFIPPREGHAVVNVGDSLRFLSGGALTSSLHRVVPPPPPPPPPSSSSSDAHPDTAAPDKFSVIYFLRPEFDAQFTTHDGRRMNSVEWHNQKYALFREASLDAAQHGAMLTGRQGYLGATGGES